MSEGTNIVRIKSKDEEIEMGLDSHGEMAFTAWLEAARDARAEHTLTAADFLKNKNRNGPQRDR